MDENKRNIRLWLYLLSTVKIIESELQLRMRNNFNSSLSRFDILSQLERNPEGIRMGLLSELIIVTAGNITGLATRLEKDGLIVRLPDPDDRRASIIKITQTGLDLFYEMKTQHQAWINELLAGIKSEDKEILSSLLSSTKSKVNDIVHQHPILK